MDERVYETNGERCKASQGRKGSMERQERPEVSITTSATRSSTSSGRNAGVLMYYMGPDSKESARMQSHTQEGTDRWNAEEKWLGAMLITGRSFE